MVVVILLASISTVITTAVIYGLFPTFIQLLNPVDEFTKVLAIFILPAVAILNAIPIGISVILWIVAAWRYYRYKRFMTSEGGIKYDEIDREGT